MNVHSITPAELKRRLEAGEDLLLLDVREPEEVALCRIEGSLCIPLGELARRHVELDPLHATVCVCHHGVRSARAAAALAQRGFERLYNLSGGIDRWAEEVEFSMQRY